MIGTRCLLKKEETLDFKRSQGTSAPETSNFREISRLKSVLFPLATESVIWVTELEKIREFLPFAFNHIVINTAKTRLPTNRPIIKLTKKVLELAQQQTSPPARLKTQMNQAPL